MGKQLATQLEVLIYRPINLNVRFICTRYTFTEYGCGEMPSGVKKVARGSGWGFQWEGRENKLTAL